MLKNLFLFIFLITFSKAYVFNAVQIENMKECIRISKIFNNPPSLVCSILLNETAAGKNSNDKIGDKFLKPFNRSYGIMQVRFQTCKDMIKKFNIKELKKMPDEKILVHLIEDNKFNLTVANIFISYLRKKYNDDIKKIVIAYNSGYYNPKNKKYWKRFLKNREFYKKFIKKFGE
jgi:hypothetical protein